MANTFVPLLIFFGMLYVGLSEGHDNVKRQVQMVVPPGEDCKVSSECDGNGDTTYCNELGMCWCLPDLIIHPIDGGMLCLKKATAVGEECQEETQCQQGEPGSLSTCEESEGNPSKKVCQCNEDAVHQPPNQRCYPKANLIGDSCVVDRQCTVNLGEHGMCNTATNICECHPRESIPSDDDSQCLPIRDEIGETCVVKMQCTNGALRGFSDCLDSQKEGVPEGTKVCNCTADAINDPTSGSSECYQRRIYIGDECRIDPQCTVNMGELSICFDRKCDCRSDGVPNGDNTVCLTKATKIGDFCTEAAQCQKGEPGIYSDCVPSEDDPDQNICICTTESIQMPGGEVCLKKAVRVGDECVDVVQCKYNLGDLTVCEVDDGCSCLTDISIPSQNRDACLAIVNEIGDHCTESIQCQAGDPGNLSVCKENICQCTPDAVNEPPDHTCRPRAGFIGGTCQNNAQCKNNLGNLSECTGGVCDCTPGYGIPSSDKLTCLQIIHSIGVECVEAQQCQKGIPGEYSDCQETSLIPGDKKVCNCSDIAVHAPYRHQCFLKLDKIGDACEINEQCSARMGPHSECSSNICLCKPGVAIPNDQETYCLSLIDIIGDECTESEQCRQGGLGSLSECIVSPDPPYNKICNCTDEGINEPEKHVCLKKADLVGDNCQFDGQCTANLGDLAKCNLEDGTCGCKPGSAANTALDFCIPGGKYINEPCFDEQQCVGIPGQSSTCSAGICRCLQTYVASIALNDCLAVRNTIGDHCLERAQCQQGQPSIHSDCVPVPDADPPHGTCQCLPTAIVEPGKNECHLKAVHVGDPCKNNDQCLIGLGYSQCLVGKCVCYDNSTSSSDNTKCIQKYGLGEPCFDSTQCADVEHAECHEDDKVCVCEDGYRYFLSQKCSLMASLIEGSCMDDPHQCDNIPAAYCNDPIHQCDCKSQTHLVSAGKEKCLEKLHSLHEECEENQQCQRNNSQCLLSMSESKKTCQCIPDEFTESSNTDGNCVKVLGEEGALCEDDAQCKKGIGDNSACDGGHCRCSNEYSFYKGECYHKTTVGDACEKNEECEVGANTLAYCKKPEEICACKEPAFPDKDTCWHFKYVGDACTHDDECSVSILGSSECIESMCLCSAGYSSDMGGVICSSGAAGLLLQLILYTMSILFAVLQLV